MTVQLTFDQDPPITGLPDQGEQEKQYPAGTPALGHAEVTTEPVGSGDVVEADYSLPLVVTPSADTVNAGEALIVNGSGLAANGTGTLALIPGEPGTDGEPVVSADVTANAQGVIPETTLTVPDGTADGPYHLVLSGGAVVIDNKAVTVGAGGGGGTITADKTEVDSAGDAAARTVTVTGTGFTASTAGRIAVMTGAPGSGGNEIAGADITTDAQGAFPATPIEVPEGQAPGDYHITATVGESTSDETALTVTNGGGAGTITADPAEIDSSGDEAARTVTVSGTGFASGAAGRVAIMTGAPGSGGTEVVGADVTTGADGSVPATALVVPQDQAAGDYHVTGVFGDVTADNTPLTVTNGGGGEATLTADKTEVDSSGDEAARTVSVTGTGFPPSTEVTLSINPGSPGSGGTAIVTGTATSGEDGTVAATALIIPQDQAAGDYHVVGVAGDVTADATPLTVTNGGGGEPTITADPTTVDSTGDEAARTIAVTGTGFTPEQTGGTIELLPGAPGTAGTAVVSAPVDSTAEGAIEGSLIVPADQEAGDYHIVATLGEEVVDNTAITVTGSAGEATLTPDKTTVDSSGDEAARTVSVTGAGLPASTAGRVAVMTGATGSGGTEVAGVDGTTDAQGALAAVTVIVPQGQAAGEYHITGTFGETVVDNNPLTVTGAAVAESAKTTRTATRKKK